MYFNILKKDLKRKNNEHNFAVVHYSCNYFCFEQC